MNWTNIITTVVGALLVSAILWLASNMVFASDLVKLEQSVNQVQAIVLQREIRDVSRELRALDAKADLTDAEKRYQETLEDDLDTAQDELDTLKGVN